MQTAISSDGRLVATVSAHGDVSIWRVANGTASPAWRRSTNGRDPVFSRDGRKLAATVDDKTVGIFNAESGSVLQRITSDGKILGVTFSPAAQYALAIEEPVVPGFGISRCGGQS